MTLGILVKEMDMIFISLFDIKFVSPSNLYMYTYIFLSIDYI